MTPREYTLARAYRAGTEEVGWETVSHTFPKDLRESAKEAYYLGYNDSISEMESTLDSLAYDGVMYDESATMSTGRMGL